MPKSWALQDAKNKFSEVVERAQRGGPQLITRRGHEVAVVLSVEEYRRLRRPTQDLVDFFRASPLTQVRLELERDTSAPRPDLDL